MPELPEVEVSRLGLLPHLQHQRVSAVRSHVPQLRRPIPAALDDCLRGRRLADIVRRGKYLLFDFSAEATEAADSTGGWLLLHLGMSGSLRLVTPGSARRRHDHLEIDFDQTCLRLHDPRRFGVVDWIPAQAAPPERHPLLAHQGIEPLCAGFTGDWLYAQTRERQIAIKPFLMDSRRIVGVGNIYAAESLFIAGIAPQRPAGQLRRAECTALVSAVRHTLEAAIAAGGSSVRDYVHSDGGAGSFQLRCQVYGRAGLPCLRCGQPLADQRLGGRASCYCRHCQH